MDGLISSKNWSHFQFWSLSHSSYLFLAVRSIFPLTFYSKPENELFLFKIAQIGAWLAFPGGRVNTFRPVGSIKREAIKSS